MGGLQGSRGVRIFEEREPMDVVSRPCHRYRELEDATRCDFAIGLDAPLAVEARGRPPG
jgi:hypothetical protein